MNRLSKKYLKKAEIYKYFVRNGAYDLSDKALEDMYRYETFGDNTINIDLFNSEKPNGYFYGKKWFDWHKTEWKDGIDSGLFYKEEFENDNSIPKNIRVELLKGL